MSRFTGVHRSGCMWIELQMQPRLNASDWITVSSRSHSVDFSLNNSVCFDHLLYSFLPFLFLFAPHFVQNRRDDPRRQTDIDSIGDSPAHACSHRRRFVSGGSALSQSSGLHFGTLWPSFALKFLCVALSPLPVHRSCRPLAPIADTDLQEWLYRSYTPTPTHTHIHTNTLLLATDQQPHTPSAPSVMWFYTKPCIRSPYSAAKGSKPSLGNV